MPNFYSQYNLFGNRHSKSIQYRTVRNPKISPSPPRPLSPNGALFGPRSPNRALFGPRTEAQTGPRLGLSPNGAQLGPRSSNVAPKGPGRTVQYPPRPLSPNGALFGPRSQNGALFGPRSQNRAPFGPQAQTGPPPVWASRRGSLSPRARLHPQGVQRNGARFRPRG